MDLSERNRSLIIVIFLLVTVGIMTYLFATRSGIFDLRKRASTPGGTTTLSFQPTESTVHYQGDEFPLDVFFNANGKMVTGIAFRFIFQNSGIVNVVDKNASQPDNQILSFAQDLDLSFTTSVNQSAAQPSGQVYVDYSAITNLAGGFTNTSGQRLASIIFKALRSGNVPIDHDPNRSIVTEKITSGTASGTLDVLQTIPRYTLRIAADTQAPQVAIQGDFGQVPGSASSSAVTFTWTGTELPARPTGTVAPITYSYQFDSQAWSPYTVATTITRTLSHGQHTFRVRAKDATGNISTPTTPTSQRTFTLNLAPVITSRTPEGGQIGSQVTINGYNFGATQGTAIVKFGSTPVTRYISWSDNRIVVQVPTGANGDISVVRSPLMSNAFPFSLGTMLRLVFNFEGITQDRGAKKVNLSVRLASQTTPQTFTDRDATWSSTDNAYAVTVGPLQSITTASTYVVSLSGESRLRKTFSNVTITNNTYNTIRRTAVPTDSMKLADFNNDNKLSIEDIGYMLNKFVAISTPATGDIAPYDVNSDLVFDSIDIALVLSKYTQLETSGDNP